MSDVIDSREAAATPTRDLVFTDADFARLRRMIGERAGIALSERKREMAYSRLARRVRLAGQRRFADYLDPLEADASHPEWEHFTNALTTNLTSFFREAHHFPLLAEHVARRSGPISIWCCAASTGEEPWSIAITLAETLGSAAERAEIVATDIDTRALADARAGIYPLAAVEKLSEERRKRFFLRGTGARSGLARVAPALRSRVHFAPLNLASGDWPVDGPFDAIFCRNLMIYFDKDTQQRVLKRFAGLMKPDGLLFAGHSENFSYFENPFVLRGQTVYRLRGGAR
ncbi:CheR family methyltransferase [Salinisphaera hydrothermalis]|uniref:Chemotaxis protein methyltransferase n=1 Tax=Salinisphaera hydrothermalis (strain C41B8) TaxID=1304275 RepID=A0A084IMW2_SALHC|nr:CheR family methyltransferase [Salinisphaera hydrothermalis]KEZ78046.1 CheR-type MCP methyltransferase [Salinisphaera hydrothermalis C41B8]